MDELQIMQRAKDYVDQLAKGIDPLTGQEVPEGEIIHNVRISRCLFYVSDLLRQMIESGGAPAKPVSRQQKAPFSLSPEARRSYPFSSDPVTVSVIAQGLNDLVDLDAVQKLKTASITTFLLRSGLLMEEETPSGGKARRPTVMGRRYGISTAQRTGPNGPYTLVCYDREAQQFILDNLDAIMAVNAEPLHENQGKPWGAEEDVWLRQAFHTGTDVKEMSAYLKRSRGSIRTRLEKLGLTTR